MSTAQQHIREEFWTGHITNRKKSSLEIRAYCREKGISHNTFYYWRRKLSSRLPAIKKPNLPINTSAFTPVEITTSTSSKACADLPDAKWLGEFSAALIRGLR